MCGACGSGRVTAAWEDVLAGAGPARRAARAAAVNRLLAGRQLRVSSWRGGYLLRTATGGARPAASLDELWAAVGEPPAFAGPTSDAEERWTWAPLPMEWNVQAGIVWLSAAVRAGAVTEVVLPARAAGGEDVAGNPIHLLPPDSSHSSRPDEIGVLASGPAAVLAALVAFACRSPGGRSADIR